jgi:mercuric ion transport protein
MMLQLRTQESRLPAYFSLFASLGTLVCCALPSVLVLIGLGAAVASALSAAPWLVTLSRHKEWVFAITGIGIAANAYYVYRLAPRLRLDNDGCLPGEGTTCDEVSRFSRLTVVVSIGIYLIGFAVAFALGPLLVALDR